MPVKDRGRPGGSLLGSHPLLSSAWSPDGMERGSQGGSLCVSPSWAPPPGYRGPYGFALGQPVGDAQATDFCCDLLPMARLGDPDGREVLGRGEAP